MQPIKKRILTDEDQRPIAVQIDYADWLEIERLLHLREENRPSSDVSQYAGSIYLHEDPLDFQARIRGEWA